jgi:uncharacterized sulfatase
MRPERRAAWIIASAMLSLAAGTFADPARADAPDAAKSRTRWNVLFIAVDDLNTDLACYGDPVVRSPHIDRLATRGVRFDRAYCQYPLCNPSRTSFLSGRRPDTTRIHDNGTPPRTTLGSQFVFLPEYFHKAGYFTGRVGKIAHETFADTVSWDFDNSGKGRANGNVGKAARKALKQQAQAEGGALKLQWLATGNADEDEPDGRTARRVAQLLEEHRDGPFFIAAGFHKPHLPWIAPKKYFEHYPPTSMKLPDGLADDRADIPPVALTRTRADDEMSDDQRRQAIAAYHAATSFTDAQVGVLLDAMDRLRLWENTVVVFLGDHGFHLGEHGGLWRKMTVFEEAARVPLIVAAPGASRGVVSPRLVELVDLYPTLTELCGLSKPEGLEGTSFVALLSNPSRNWKTAAFTQVVHGRVTGRSVRTERYRYTEWGNESFAELYDHQADPQEFKNLAKDPKHAGTVAALKRLLHQGWREVASVPNEEPAR